MFRSFIWTRHPAYASANTGHPLWRFCLQVFSWTGPPRREMSFPRTQRRINARFEHWTRNLSITSRRSTNWATSPPSNGKSCLFVYVSVSCYYYIDEENNNKIYEHTIASFMILFKPHFRKSRQTIRRKAGSRSTLYKSRLVSHDGSSRGFP